MTYLQKTEKLIKELFAPSNYHIFSIGEDCFYRKDTLTGHIVNISLKQMQLLVFFKKFGMYDIITSNDDHLIDISNTLIKYLINEDLFLIVYPCGNILVQELDQPTRMTYSYKLLGKDEEALRRFNLCVNAFGLVPVLGLFLNPFRQEIGDILDVKTQLQPQQDVRTECHDSELEKKILASLDISKVSNVQYHYENGDLFQFTGEFENICSFSIPIVNERIHGEHLTKYISGREMLRTSYNQGLKHGNSIAKSESGVGMSDISYDQGVITEQTVYNHEGYQTNHYYYQDGNISYSSKYCGTKEQEILSEVCFLKDKKILKEFYPNRILKSIQVVSKNNEKNRTIEKFSEKVILLSSETFVDDKLHGEQTYHCEDHILVVTYIQGEKQKEEKWDLLKENLIESQIVIDGKRYIAVD